MRTPHGGLVLLAALVLGCASAESPSKGNTGTGGDEGGDTGGAGGTSTGGSGTKPTGSGGSVGTGGSAPTGGAGGGDTGGAGGASPADAGTEADTAAPTMSGEAPYGCTKCTRIFNGMNLDGWVTAAGSWVVKDGVLASTGKTGDIYTKDDLGDYRIFFQVRHVMGNPDHKPCTVMFGKRPADPTVPARSLGGAQFQPPNGGSWNYGVGGTFNRPMNPMFDATKWHQCEVLVKEAGSFRAACCPVGPTPCKAVEVLDWKGPGRKHPFDIMIHNAGLFDEYKEIWLEQSPTVDDLLSIK
jgi:hypothetical protein